MTDRRWALVEVTARLLEPCEREAVLGDLLEAGEAPWRGSLDILGLATLRQLLHWKSWQPWLATLGLALPGSFLLMGDLCIDQFAEHTPHRFQPARRVFAGP